MGALLLGALALLLLNSGKKTQTSDTTSETPPERKVESESVVEVTTEDGAAVRPNSSDAARSAQSVADHVRNKQYKYNRAQLAAWQALAGLKPDGLYGPATVAKLRGYGAKNVNPQLFKGAK